MSVIADPHLEEVDLDVVGDAVLPGPAAPRAVVGVHGESLRDRRQLLRLLLRERKRRLSLKSKLARKQKPKHAVQRKKPPRPRSCPAMSTLPTTRKPPRLRSSVVQSTLHQQIATSKSKLPRKPRAVHPTSSAAHNHEQQRQIKRNRQKTHLTVR